MEVDYLGQPQLEQVRCNSRAVIKADFEDDDLMSADRVWLAETTATDAHDEKPACRTLTEVEIIDTNGLRNIDWTGMPKPYCVVQVAGKGDRWLRRRTKPHEDWKNPSGTMRRRSEVNLKMW